MIDLQFTKGLSNMCGIIGVIGQPTEKSLPFWSSYDAYRGLLTLQHRGQDAAGILSYDYKNKMFHTHKDLGLITQAFQGDEIKDLVGDMAIGHTRYATTGSDGSNDLQPMVTGFPFGLGMAHNGNLVNYFALRDRLVNEHEIQLLTNNDLEIMMHLWSLAIQESRAKKQKISFNDITYAANSLMNQVEGGYAIVGLMGNVGLFAMRDPNGVRPLVMGAKKNQLGETQYCFVSESLALNFLGYEFVRDVRPGEVVLVTEEGEVFSKELIPTGGPAKTANCMFEWIYFAAAESSLEHQSVYGARLKLGQKLAQKVQPLLDSGAIKADFVCPVPDTSRTASISLAEKLGIPYREGLIKNRYVQRSFILNTQEAREKAVELKLSPVRSEIAGKDILLVDDSIVRGTTSKKIISLLKKFGACSITLAITSPPLRFGCYYGIDFPSDQDLIANGKDEEAIAKWVGAEKVIYLDEQDLRDCIEVKGLCMGCINKEYPTDLSSAEEFSRRRNDYR